MKQHDSDHPYRILIMEKYKKIYNEIKTKRVHYFESGFELYYLSMAYTILIEYILEEKYEECSVIRDVIELFMRHQPGAVEISLNNMKNYKVGFTKDKTDQKNKGNGI